MPELEFCQINFNNDDINVRINFNFYKRMREERFYYFVKLGGFYMMFSTNSWTRRLPCFAMLSFTSHESILKICAQKMGLYIKSFLKLILILDLDTLKAFIVFYTVAVLFVGLYEHIIPSPFRNKSINISLQALFWGVLVST